MDLSKLKTEIANLRTQAVKPPLNVRALTMLEKIEDRVTRYEEQTAAAAKKAADKANGKDKGDKKK